MADYMDPQAVEVRSQLEQESYRLYKRRWLVLFAMFSVLLVVGLHKSVISVVNHLEEHIGMNGDQYDIFVQISMYTIVASVISMARALDYFGLRRIAYVACFMIICANTFKALCLAPDSSFLGNLSKSHRYKILIVSETFAGLAYSIGICIPAKVASAWFAHYENTLALVIANCGYNVGVGFSNYFTPIFVTTGDEISKLSYMFLVSAVLVTFIVLTCVTRSSPKMPPSSITSTSSATNLALGKGLFVMLSNPSYVLLLLTIAINLSIINVEQLELDNILRIQQYSNDFVGTIIAQAYFFGTFFMLMGGAWVDNSANYVKVSRISCIICGFSLVFFNMSILLPNIKNVILVSNVVASFGCSLMYPALFQVGLRSALTVLPEATVAAIIVVLQQTLSGVLMNLLGPLKSLSVKSTGYQAPLLIFSCISMLVNFLYATSFVAPSREELRKRLGADDLEQIISEEQASNNPTQV